MTQSFRCDRCLDPRDLGAYGNAVICQKCKVKGFSTNLNRSYIIFGSF